VAAADVSANINRPLRTSILPIAIGPPESKGRHPTYLGVLICYRRLIGRFLFDYIGNSPITRTDEDDLIIFDEEHVGSSLRHFLHDFGWKWIELNIIRYNISGAEFSFCTFVSLRISLMMYSCSAVSVRRGAGATAGGALVCACTFSPDAHKAISPANAAATARKLERRSENVM
jgi:hypothetical protein